MLTSIGCHSLRERDAGLLDQHAADDRGRAELVDRLAAVPAFAVLAALPIVRHPHLPFLECAFELRDNATMHHALSRARGGTREGNTQAMRTSVVKTVKLPAALAAALARIAK